MIGVILCGGLGTRLRGVLTDIPKAMAPVNGRPFLEYQLEFLKTGGVQKIVLCAGYRWEAIREHFGDGSGVGLHLTYSVEDRPLGTAGCIKLAEGHLAEPALVLNGDTFVSFDIIAMYGQHRNTGAKATVAVAEVPDATEFGTVELGPGGRLLGFREKRPGAGFVNAGAYLFDPTALSYLAPGKSASLEYDFLPALLSGGEPVYGYRIDGSFLDIGTPERYQRAQERRS